MKALTKLPRFNSEVLAMHTSLLKVGDGGMFLKLHHFAFSPKSLAKRTDWMDIETEARDECDFGRMGSDIRSLRRAPLP